MIEVDVQKLALEPGDILVVQIAENLDPKHVHEIFDYAMQKAGVSRVPMLIGRKGDLELSVVKAPPGPPDIRTPMERRCQKCGSPTKGEEALVDGQCWCHPCADRVC